MILVRVGGDLSRALGAVGGRTPVAALLSVDDRPPVDGAPKLGRVRVGGWVHRIAPAEADLARLEFAEANPVEDLLDVGSGVTLYAIEVDRVGLGKLQPGEVCLGGRDPVHPAAYPDEIGRATCRERV